MFRDALRRPVYTPPSITLRSATGMTHSNTIPTYEQHRSNNHRQNSRPSTSNDEGIGSTCSVLLKILSVAGALYTFFLCGAFMQGLNIIYVELIRIYDVTRTEASLLITVFVPVSACTSIINAYFVRKCGLGLGMLAGAVFGCVGCLGAALATELSLVVVSLGGVTAYGYSIVFLGSLTVPAQIFSSMKHRNLLTNLLAVINGVGLAVGSPLLDLFVETFGFRLAMVLCSGMFLLSYAGSMPLWMLLYTKKLHHGSPKQTNLRMFIYLAKNKTYISYLACDCFRIVFVSLLLFFQVDHIVSLGFDLDTGAMMASIFGILTLVGRILNGVLLLIKHWHAIHQFSVFLTLFSGTMLILAFVKSYSGLLVLSCFLGLFSGPVTTLSYAILSEVVRPDTYDIALAAQLFLYGLATMGISPIAGWIRDTTGSYTPLFYSALPCCGVASLLLSGYLLIQNYRRKLLIENHTIMSSGGKQPEIKRNQAEQAVQETEAI